MVVAPPQIGRRSDDNDEVRRRRSGALVAGTNQSGREGVKSPWSTDGSPRLRRSDGEVWDARGSPESSTAAAGLREEGVGAVVSGRPGPITSTRRRSGGLRSSWAPWTRSGRPETAGNGGELLRLGFALSGEEERTGRRQGK